ncbi:ABC transporter ATP-binding protein [Paenibacillus sp. TRM 82003]|nr:ABC transporter ATP-binding protein [Paenibacillus sp. TRM 82003]
MSAAAAREPVLSVRNVTKRIGKNDIIRGVGFDVFPGEVFGFLGPNGSGKTTTIRMLVGLMRPTSGQVLVAGKDVQREHEAALRAVGCIVENPEMYPYLTGRENLELFAGLLPDVGPERIREVAEIVGMDARIDEKVRTYSLGMRQRLGIAQALLGRPKLLILDEPTNGLDPQGIKELRTFVRGLAEQGVAVFVSSHLLSEIQLMCDRVAILSRGRVLAVGRVDELLEQSKETVVWRVSPAADGLRMLGGEAELVSADGEAIVVRMERERIPDLNRRLVEAGVAVTAIETRQPALEELFLQLTEGELP